MSCYSVPKCLLHLLFGGSAIWLGTTFCSPLAAIDMELPPTPASAPNALADPEQTAQQSIVPAASLETGEADYWDAGPVVEDTACADDFWCDEDTYCDEYDYEGYDAEDEQVETNGVESDDADGLVDTPDESMYSNLEDGDEDFEYDWAADDEEAYATDQEEAEDYSYDEDYGYDEEYTYDYGEMNSPEEQPEELEEQPEEIAENADSAAEDRFSYEFDDYEMYYGDEDDTPELSEETPAEQVMEDEGDELYESELDDYYYEDEYEYYHDEAESDSRSAMEETAPEETTTAGQKGVDDEADEALHESEWEDYYYEDEYQDDRDVFESDSQQAAEEMVSEEPAVGETDAEEAWADEYEYEYDEYDDYDDYDYDYDYDSHDYDANEYDGIYDMEDAFEADAATDESAAASDESYDYIDPLDQYGHEYEVPYEWQEMEQDGETEADLEVLARQPGELLADADCDLIRSIERLSGKPAAMRRACLNEYIEALGFAAIDFAYRYEDATDADVLTLAEDLPGAAAFLASYRLVEQGRIGMDDAVVLLEGTLSGLSLDWIEDVGRIVAAERSLSASHPVVDAMAAVATQSIAGVSALAAVVSERLATVPWAEVSERLGEFRSASRASETDDAITF